MSQTALDPVKTPTNRRFGRVLVCLDQSETAERVLPLATYLTRIDAGRMTLLHVLEALPDAAEVRATDALEWDIVRQEAQAYLDRLAARAEDHGVSTEPHVAEGSAAHRVAALASEIDADLVVLSTVGKGGNDAWPLGSTAQKILALAAGAVLVIPGFDAGAAPRVPPQRLLVPLDGSLRGESVLPTVVHLALADDAEVVVTHVVHDPVRTEVLSMPDDLALAGELADRLSESAAQYLTRIQSQLVASGVRVRPVVSRATDHRQGIVTLATDEGADLLIVSAHGSTCNPRRRFGSVTSYLLGHSTTPVLVVQDLPKPTRHTTTATGLRPPSWSTRTQPSDA